MQAFQIAYDDRDSLVALGWPNGLVEVAAVNTDGSPGARVATLFTHRHEIVFLAFVGRDRLVSVDDHGRIVVTAVPGGAAVHTATIGGENVVAGLSPDGAALFLFSYDGARDTNTFAFDLASGRVTYGPKARALSVKCRVFGLDGHRGAYYFLNERQRGKAEEVVEALVVVDFDSGAIELRELAGGPDSTFGELPVFDLNVARGVGVRLGFTHPLELFDRGGVQSIGLPLEVFDPITLELRRTVVGLGLAADSDDEAMKLVKKGTPGTAPYRKKVADLLERYNSLKITADGAYAWVGAAGGAVRRVSLADGTRSALVVHGRVSDPRGMTLDDVFARNLTNNHTLGVSPSGRFVGFGNPNEFFCADGLGAGEPIMLPPRASTADTTAPPAFARVVHGGRLVLGLGRDHTANVAVVDLASKQTELALAVAYGSHLRDASRSPSGAEYLIAYAGRDSLRVRPAREDLPIVLLPLPPHTILAEHLAEDRAVLVHHQGAVISLTGDALHAYRHEAQDDDDEDDDEDDDDEDEDEDDADDESGDADSDAEPDEDDGPPPVQWTLANPSGVEPLELVGNMEGVFVYNDYFEQRDDVYGAALARIDGVDHVVILIEGGRLVVYRLGDDEIHGAYEHRVASRHGLAARGARAAVYQREGGKVEVLDLASTRCTRLVAFEGNDLALVDLTADGRELVILDGVTGVCSLFDLATRTERAVFAYVGPVLRGASYDAESGRVVLVEDTGAVIVVDRGGAVEAVLRIPRGAEAAGGEAGGEAREDATFAPAVTIEHGGATVGRIELRSGLVSRALLDDAALQVQDEEREERQALFEHESSDPAERALARQFEAAIEAYQKIAKKDHAKRLAVLTRFVKPFEGQRFGTVAGRDTRVDIGRCFTIRGCVRVEMGKLGAAEADFERGLAFRYWPAYDELAELATKRGDHATAIRLVEEVLGSFDAKKAIGLRSSLSVYRSYLQALVMTGAAARARYVLRHVVENLLPHLEDDDDDKPKRGKAKPAKAKATKAKSSRRSARALALAAKLEPITKTLKAVPKGPARELATELLAELDAALAAFPKDPADDEAASDRLRDLHASAEFQIANDRWGRVAPLLNPVLAPHERAPYFGSPLPGGVRHRLGEAFGLRGQARLRAGDARGAAADFAKAIEYREVRHYPDLVEIQLGALAAPDAALRTCDELFTSPFNWSSEYYTPVSRFDCAYMLAARALAERRSGGAGSIELLRRLYLAELGAVADRLTRALSARREPVVAGLVEELRVAQPR